MITNIKDFRKHLIKDGYQMKPGDTIKMMPDDKRKMLANSALGKNAINRKFSDSGTGNENNDGKIPKIKIMPDFVRVTSHDMNPNLSRSIAIAPLDIVYELKLDGIPVYSEQLDTIVKGDALYYGWKAENETKPAYFFVTLTTIDENDQPSYSYISIHEMTKDEMIDIIWQLTECIDEIHKQILDVLNPDTMSGGRLSDNADFFH